MPTYVILMNLTEQGIRNIKDVPKRIEAGTKALENMGGKLIGFYMTMGEYDYITIGEAPSDEAVATFLLALGSLGNVRTKTLKAFTKEEFVAIVNKLP